MTKSYFKLEEQVCPCCKTGRFAPDFLDMLNQAREIAGIPFIINSGFRCESYNKKVGGTERSAHLVGCACDIKTEDNYTRKVVLDSLLKVGFNRIGIGKNFIHVDNDFTKPQNVIWLY